MSNEISQSNASPSQNAICEETFNQLIAVAGRQRMLSQRLGLSLMLAASSSGEGGERPLIRLWKWPGLSLSSSERLMKPSFRKFRVRRNGSGSSQLQMPVFLPTERAVRVPS